MLHVRPEHRFTPRQILDQHGWTPPELAPDIVELGKISPTIAYAVTQGVPPKPSRRRGHWLPWGRDRWVRVGTQVVAVQFVQRLTAKVTVARADLEHWFGSVSEARAHVEGLLRTSRGF